MTKRFDKPAPKPSQAPLPARHPDQDVVDALVAEMDRDARAVELEWGVGRLPALVGADTLLALKRGLDARNEAMAAKDAPRLREIVVKLRGAYAFMAAEARAAGFAPMSPDVWEARMPDGRVLAIVRTAAEAHAVAASGRDVVCLSMAEVARVVALQPAVIDVLAAFPGSRVENATKRGESFAGDFASSDALFDLIHGEDA